MSPSSKIAEQEGSQYQLKAVQNDKTPLTPVHTDSASNELTPEQWKDIRQLTVSMQKPYGAGTLCQYVFDPISRPASRLASIDSSSGISSHTSSLVNTPLTPADSGQKDAFYDSTSRVTPQESPFVTDQYKSENLLQGDQATIESDLIQPSEDATPSATSSGVKTPFSDPYSRQDDTRTSNDSSGGNNSQPTTQISQQPPSGKRRNIPDPRFFKSEHPDALEQQRAQVLAPKTESTSPASIPSTSSSSIPKKDKKEHNHHNHHHSFVELKRFFKLGSSKKHKDKDKDDDKDKHKAGKSKDNHKKTSAFRKILCPSHSKSSQFVMPFADDHRMEDLGILGDVLGSGVGGSVQLMTRREDGRTFAVKKFRERNDYESIKDYTRKVHTEYCLGSTLQHDNLCHALDMLKIGGFYYEIMEYAKYALFDIVMTGLMTRPEITCCILQILNGVNYLHGQGIAHRDLKLDNVVVDEYGIMKIIDFGSAFNFQEPGSSEKELATGIVGSNPYLAPEVLASGALYDAAMTDIWSIAIMYFCMILTRFPWKKPDSVTDPSYKLFATQPSKEEYEWYKAEDAKAEKPGNHVKHMKGPWRILRNLPHRSRYIMGRMVEIDPRKRATLEEILSSSWVAENQFCSPSLFSTTHDHVLWNGKGNKVSRKLVTRDEQRQQTQPARYEIIQEKEKSAPSEIKS